jgi:hypothetical protein
MDAEKTQQVISSTSNGASAVLIIQIVFQVLLKGSLQTIFDLYLAI